MIRTRFEPMTTMDPPRRPRVLCVDDERMIGELVEQVLESELDCEVERAENGLEALDALHRGEFEVILADYMMPRMDGGELYRRLEVESPELAARLVFMTGDTLSNETLRDIEGTGRLLIKKPFGLDELTDAVRFMIGKAKRDALLEARVAG